MKRLYQYIDIPGKELRREGKGRDKSKFWNEGKWKNFIEPLIPEESLDFPFLEIGSSSGLFLKMAEERGFRHVIGIEGEPERVLTTQWYKESLNAKFKIIPEYVISSFDWNRLPRFGLTLIANTHYYIPIVDFAETIAALRDRTLYLIIVSASVEKKFGRPSPYIGQVRGYFKDWTEIGAIENISVEGDPSPREGMYGIIFKSNLETLPLSRFDHYARGYDEILNMTQEFYRGADIESSKLYQYHLTRLPPEKAYKFVLGKKELYEDIKENGIKKLVYTTENKIRDGVNRCIIAKELGYKRVMMKKL